MPRKVRTSAGDSTGDPAADASAELARLREENRELRQAAERYRLALWAGGDELFDWDLAAGTLFSVSGNPARPPGQAVPVSGVEAFAPYVHPEDFPAYRAAIEEHLADQSHHYEANYRLRGPHGDWVWKVVRGMVVERDADGKPLRIAETQHDISDTKTVEQLRAAIEDLRRTQSELIESEKMASLGRLVAGVAHEVNTPLGVALTAVSFLRSQLARAGQACSQGASPAELRQLLVSASEGGAMVERNLVRAADMIRSFKQVAVDQTSGDARIIELRTYLEDALQSLHPVLRQTAHRVSLECGPSIKLRTRPDALYQIVSNLVMNSLNHAYPHGGSGHLRLTVEEIGDSLRLRYEDDGVGMDEEIARRVFEPFFTTRRGRGGTGLGMMLVFNLVTQTLAGRIALSTQPNAGVRFDIDIPRQ